jgi:hypothetical protein
MNKIIQTKIIMKILLSYLLFFSVIIVYGQNNFKSAFFVDNAGNTVNGYINFKSDFENSQAFEFKNSDTDTNKTVYYPDEIQLYRFTEVDIYYVSKDVNGQKRFLQYLVNGEINLYYTTDKNEQTYYYFEKDGVLTEVTKQADKTDGTNLIQDVSYRKKFSKLFYAYPSIMKEVKRKNMSFTQTKMIDIAKEYHLLTCTDSTECIVYKYKHPDSKFIDVNFTLALSYNHFFNLNPNLKNYGIPGIDIGMALYYPRFSEYTSTRIEWTVFPKELIAALNDNANDDVTLPLMMKFGQRIMFNRKKFSQGIEGGIILPIAPYGAFTGELQLSKKITLSIQIGYILMLNNVFCKIGLEL